MELMTSDQLLQDIQTKNFKKAEPIKACSKLYTAYVMSRAFPFMLNFKIEINFWIL